MNRNQDLLGKKDRKLAAPWLRLEKTLAEGAVITLEFAVWVCYNAKAS
jgi:hypothetical protein